MNTKQIVVIRKDLNMRKGKIAAQAAHACMAFLTKAGVHTYRDEQKAFVETHVNWNQLEEIQHWLNNSFRKICVYVNSEEELEEIHKKALDKGLVSHMVVDSGLTEFGGVPTKTCIAIGPHFDDKFIGVTNDLPLL